MTELEKLDAGLEYCFFDASVVARKEMPHHGTVRLHAGQKEPESTGARSGGGSVQAHVPSRCGRLRRQ